MICKVDECNDAVLRHGFCNKHLLRWRRHGDPLGGGRFRAKETKKRRDNMAEYKCWDHMVYRCVNPDSEAYANYGGRGITVCERWRDSFDAFLNDMGSRPSRLHTIDRIDNDGNYEPGNCRWATKREQANNKRDTVKVAYHGREVTISDLRLAAGLKHSTLFMRIQKYGWSLEDAVSTPVGKRRASL